MKPLSLVGLATFGLVVAAAPASGSIMVLGDSIGHACYASARAQLGTRTALADCNTALESGKLSFEDTVATYVNRGIVKIHAGDHQAAIADFDRSIRLDPNQPESYLNKGSALLRLGGRSQEAVGLFDEAIQRKTRRPELAYFGRAIAHEDNGNLNAAYHDYRRARDLAPRWDLPAREMSRFQVRPAGSRRM
jgi:tetratricopeptide (TPR) repeat protein